MKQQTFEKQHQQQWTQLETWLNDIEKNKHKPLAQFPSLYRQVCHHLALARDRHYTPNLVERLNRLVLKGHQHLYTSRYHFWTSVLHFLSMTFPTTVRQNAQFVLLSGLLFFAPLFTVFTIIQYHPDFIYYFLDGQQVSDVEYMYNPETKNLGWTRAADDDFSMFGFYIRNNISIGFQTFASGLLFGLGSIFYLVFNGLFIGAIAGHLTHIGYTVPFFSFVSGHSALELTAIVLAGAAGLKLGFALISPQRYSRLQSLKLAAQNSIHLVYGVIIMLLFAAFVEAFWSSTTDVLPIIKYTVGIILWLLVIIYFFLVGYKR